MSNKALVLHLLKEAGDRGVTTAELLQAGCGSRYGGRILELRKKGYVIESTRVRDGSWRYELLSCPDVERDAASAPVSPRSPVQKSEDGRVSLNAGGRLFDTFDLDVPVKRSSHYDEAA